MMTFRLFLFSLFFLLSARGDEQKRNLVDYVKMNEVDALILHIEALEQGIKINLKEINILLENKRHDKNKNDKKLSLR